MSDGGFILFLHVVFGCDCLTPPVVSTKLIRFRDLKGLVSFLLKYNDVNYVNGGIVDDLLFVLESKTLQERLLIKVCNKAF